MSEENSGEIELVWLRLLQQSLSQSESEFNRQVGDMLNDALTDSPDLQRQARFVRAACDRLEAERSQRFQSEVGMLFLYSRSTPIDWCDRLLRSLLVQLRVMLCDDKSEYRKLIKGSHLLHQGVIATVAALIVKEAGHGDTGAVGVVTIAIMLLLKLSQNALCHMNDDEIIAAVNRTADGENNPESAAASQPDKKLSAPAKKRTPSKPKSRRKRPKK